MKSCVIPGLAALPLLIGCHAAGPDQGNAASAVEESAADLVTLPEAKILAAGIEVAPVMYRQVQPSRTVPGRVQYDDTRHVEIKVPTPGVLTEVRVKPGDFVASAQVLALVNSPDVGHARADVLKAQAEYDLAAQRLKWRQNARDGLRQMVSLIVDGRDLKEISGEMQDKSLGEYREQITKAYSRQLLSRELADSVKSAAGTGAIAGRTVKERQNERDAAEAALQSVIEQSSFEARQQCGAAQLAADDAQRRLRISRQHLHTLLGYEDLAALEDDSRPLSLVEVRAPFAGTIESRFFNVSERVAQGDSLFVLADTSKLWVAADIREREWEALNLAPGAELEVFAPALPKAHLVATLHYLGREVSPKTNAVPLVAALANPDGLLRPGQFVQVRLPLGEVRQALAVPEAAVMEHEGKSFVFRRETDGSFRRVDIQRGVTANGLVEIADGVKQGDPIVVAGAFFVKSELLLEREVE